MLQVLPCRVEKGMASPTINVKDIKFGKTLGQGGFGTVHETLCMEEEKGCSEGVPRKPPENS